MSSDASAKFEISMDQPTMSTEEMAAKRQKVIQEREAKRKLMLNAMAKRRMNRQHKADTADKEAIDSFMTEFTKEFDTIEADTAKMETHSDFKQLQMRRFNLETKLADAARFLPNYTFESKTKQLAKLNQIIRQTQEKVAPRPKFVFERKDSPQKPAPSSTIANGEMTVATETETATAEEEKSDVANIVGNSDEILISDQQLSTIYKAPGSINGADICLSNLTNCTVSIADHIGALRMDNIKFCTIITGPVSSSIHVEYIEQSTVHSAMRQCRIHNAKSTKFYIHVNSEPIIEHSDDVLFGPYCVAYDELDSHWQQCNVDPNTNLWNSVKDFNWFKKQQSPHWSIIPESDRLTSVEPVCDDDDEL